LYFIGGESVPPTSAPRGPPASVGAANPSLRQIRCTISGEAGFVSRGGRQFALF
jgi:hypothetical protein